VNLDGGNTMLKIFMIIAALWAYVGLVSSGKDGFVAQKSQELYEYCLSIWDEVEIDYQIPEDMKKSWKKAKKRSSRF